MAVKIDSVATRQHTTNERRGTRDGRYSEGIRSWVGIGALWGGVAGLLFAPGALVTPALALAGLSGPVAASLVGALAGAIFLGVVAVAVAIGIHVATRNDQVVKS